MWIRQLRIENFRGMKSATVEFSERQTVLVGSNGAGKSTILESLALIFGRDRLVRTLTEHDFYGSNPNASDRIRLLATITGFSSNAPSAHSQWFSENRGIPKWHQRSTGKLLSEPQSDSDELTVQVALCARFDRGELNVETIRYFHDDDAIVDPFDEEVVQTVPPRLLAEIGFSWCRRTGHGTNSCPSIPNCSGEYSTAAAHSKLRKSLPSGIGCVSMNTGWICKVH